MTALLGPNGAGKSTLVLAVAGAIRATSGTRRARRSMTSPDAVPSRSAGPGWPSCQKAGGCCPSCPSPTTCASPRTCSTGEEAERGTDYALELFPELKQRWDATARSLSGGEQQMVVLAQALVSRPAVVLVDELSLGLAPLVVKRLVPILASIAESGVGVLLIEQFAHVALGLANRAFVLQGGRIRYSGTAGELQDESRPAALGVPAAGLMESWPARSPWSRVAHRASVWRWPSGSPPRG